MRRPLRGGAFEGDTASKVLLFIVFPAMNALFPVQASDPTQPGKENPMFITMTINQQTYAIELADNPTAKAFIEQLPLTRSATSSVAVLESGSNQGR